MAGTTLRKPVITSVCRDFCRFSNSASSISGAALSFQTKTNSSDGNLLNFKDVEKLFSSMSTRNLMKSLLNLKICSSEPLVDMGIQVMNSRVMENRVIRGVVLETIKRTIYDHFCAGENLQEATDTLQRLWDAGLRGILDYGLEDAVDNASCDRNLNGFLKTVESTSLLPPSSVSFSCVKITAICPISLLRRISDLLRWQHKDASFHLPWKLITVPILCDSSPLYHTPIKPDPLTEEEERDLHRAQQRLRIICEKCTQMNVPLLIDAEYTSVQPAIDYFTYCAATQFTNEDLPIVYCTIQAYLKDSKERLMQAVENAKKKRISLGFKLVRGAYMTKETQIARSLGTSSPIHNSLRETHSCYNSCALFMVEEIARGYGSVVLATHNVESGKVVATKAEELGLGKSNKKLQFAQLKGMADGLSLGLRNAGFNVSKYLPYGPVEDVIPYLLRRAEENKGLLSSSAFDRQLMRMETKRRILGRVHCATKGFTHLF